MNLMRFYFAAIAVSLFLTAPTLAVPNVPDQPPRPQPMAATPHVAPLAVHSAAPAHPTNFKVITGTSLCSDCDVVYLDDGVSPGIDADFRTFVTAAGLKAPTLVLVIRSTGGSVDGARTLGRDLRARHARTITGAIIERPDGSAELRAGTCISACNIIFVGGVTRQLAAGTPFGVHQFNPSSDNYKNLDNMVSVNEVRQMLNLASVWIAYNSEMGIDQRLAEAQLATPAERVNFVSYDQLREFKVVTDPTPLPPQVIRQANPAMVAAAAKAPPGPPRNRMWTTIAPTPTNEWHTIVVSDEDYMRLSVSCFGTRMAMTFTLFALPEDKEVALARQIITDGGFTFDKHKFDLSQVAMQFGGGYALTTQLRPDQQEGLAASAGTITFVPGSSAQARQQTITIPTAGFDAKLAQAVRDCKVKVK